MIFTMRQLQKKCREKNLSVYMAFFDLTKAFDTINQAPLSSPTSSPLEWEACGKLLNLFCLQAKTKVIPTSAIELQYADDACVCANSEDKLQIIISIFTEAYESTVHMDKEGHKFILSAKAAIDEEIQHHLQSVSTVFSRLRKRVFENNIKFDTKITVYTAALLYGCVMWTGHTRYFKVLDLCHQCCLCQILLQWDGHAVLMTDTDSPEQVLFSQLRNDRQAPGGQKKRFRDTLKAWLAMCSIPTDTWESLAQDHPKWRRSIQEGVKHLGTCHRGKMKA
eukprot:g28284.t1